MPFWTDDQFRNLCGILERLAFLPLQLVPEGLTCIREKSTGDIGDFPDYFYCTYVNGPFRYASAPAAAPRENPSLCLTVRIRRPEFTPEWWNMCDATILDKDRTNNTCEGWNTGFQKLVGHAYPSVSRLIEWLQENQALVATASTQARRGEPPVKRVRNTTLRLQNRLKNIFEGSQVYTQIYQDCWSWSGIAFASNQSTNKLVYTIINKRGACQIEFTVAF